LEIKKPLPVKWEVRAVEDLDEIFDNIFQQSPQNAIDVINELLDLADSLGQFPEKFHSLETPIKTSRNYRFVAKWSFKIIYEVTEHSIWIMRVFNSAKHPDKLYKNLPY
jgi:toxin ParE1/3/4